MSVGTNPKKSFECVVTGIDQAGDHGPYAFASLIGDPEVTITFSFSPEVWKGHRTPSKNEVVILKDVCQRRIKNGKFGWVANKARPKMLEDVLPEEDKKSIEKYYGGVVNFIRNGKEKAFFVNLLIDKKITVKFLLNSDVWTGSRDPFQGDVVILTNIHQEIDEEGNFVWVAKKARPKMLEDVLPV